MSPLVKLTEVNKTYYTGNQAFSALHNLSLEIEAKTFVALMGHSGSGKSTLLHLIGGLDRPNTGSVQVNEKALETMNETALAEFRRDSIGFVFQSFNLVDNLTIQANVELPALLHPHVDKQAIRERSEELLTTLGLQGQHHKYPWALSGGQQQRVALARALINQPLLLLADEPTGNLDSRSGRLVLDLLSQCHQQGQTLLMVTHDPSAAAYAERILYIHDGQFVDEVPGGSAKRIAQRLAHLK